MEEQEKYELEKGDIVNYQGNKCEILMYSVEAEEEFDLRCYWLKRYGDPMATPFMVSEDEIKLWGYDE